MYLLASFICTLGSQTLVAMTPTCSCSLLLKIGTSYAIYMCTYVKQNARAPGITCSILV